MSRDLFFGHSGFWFEAEGVLASGGDLVEAEGHGGSSFGCGVKSGLWASGCRWPMSSM